MQKLIVDTNVIVSALIQKSFPYKIVSELFIEDKVRLCVSESLIAEYYEVLRRPKFAAYYDFVVKAEALLADIEAKAIMYYPKVKIDLLADKKEKLS